MLYLQEFLRGGGTLDELRVSPYQLTIREEGNLVVLRYNLANSDFSYPICREARGIILEKGTWNVVSCPFFKFFNHGERHAADIDWATATVWEKLDGTCAVLYHYGGTWNMHTLRTVSGGGTVISDGMFVEGEKTFADLFWEAWDRLYGRPTLNELDPSNTYIFELVTPFNRIVTTYNTWRLPLLGIRSLKTLKETSILPYGGMFELPKRLSLSNPTLTDLVEKVSAFEDDQEGYVVSDTHFNRVKIKSPSYFTLARYNQYGLNGRHATLQLVLSDMWDDFVSNFPEYAEKVHAMRSRLSALSDHLVETFIRLGGPSTDPKDPAARKSFALRAQSVPASWRGVLFSLLSGKGVGESIKNSRIHTVHQMLTDLEASV